MPNEFICTAGRGGGRKNINIYNLMVTRIDLLGVRDAEEPSLLGSVDGIVVVIKGRQGPGKGLTFEL